MPRCRDGLRLHRLRVSRRVVAGKQAVRKQGAVTHVKKGWRAMGTQIKITEPTLRFEKAPGERSV